MNIARMTTGWNVMQWGFWNPVKVRFGAGTFDEVAALIGERCYALVTYNQPIFNELAARLAQAAGEPVAVIDNIETNPECAPTASTT